MRVAVVLWGIRSRHLVCRSNACLAESQALWHELLHPPSSALYIAPVLPHSPQVNRFEDITSESLVLFAMVHPPIGKSYNHHTICDDNPRCYPDVCVCVQCRGPCARSRSKDTTGAGECQGLSAKQGYCSGSGRHSMCGTHQQCVHVCTLQVLCLRLAA